MRTSIRNAALSALIACCTLGPLPAGAEDLRESILDAYYYNPSLEATRAQLRSLGENIPIANARRLPSVNMSSSFQVSRTLNNFGTSNSSTPFQLGFSGAMPLYDGGEASNRVSQARANVDGGYSTLLASEQTIVFQVISSFFDVLRDAEILALTRANLEILREELVASETRFEVGEVTLTDVAQTKSRVAEANSNVVVADGNLRNSAESFRGVVGRLPGELDPPEFLPRLPRTLLAAETEALANEPTIHAARAAERAAVYAIRVAMAGKLPSVDVGTSITGTLNDSLSDDAASVTTGLNLQLNAPIYQGGAVDSAVRQARHVASQRRSEYHAAVRSVQQAVNQSWQSLVTARGAIEAGRERVKAAEIAFQGVKEELLVGSRATIDLLNAEQERLNARISLVRSVRDLNVAAYALLQSMGRLDVRAFGIEPLRETGNGVAGVEPDSPYGYPDDALTSWRFPWRP